MEGHRHVPTQACLLCGSTAGLKELAANKFENKKGIYIFFSKIPPIEKNECLQNPLKNRTKGSANVKLKKNGMQCIFNRAEINVLLIIESSLTRGTGED